MPFASAIFQREITAASRRKRYFLIRTLYLVVLLVMVLFGMWNPAGATRWMRTLTAAAVLQRFAFAQLLMVLAIAPAACLGLVHEERRQGTLDLLLLSGQGLARIIRDKLVSRLLFVELLILSSVVIAALAAFFVGIRASQVILILVVLSATALLCCSVAIFLSALFREGYAAATLSYLMLAALLWGPVAAHRYRLGSLEAMIGQGGSLGWCVTSPFLALQTAVGSGLFSQWTLRQAALAVCGYTGLSIVASGVLLVASGQLLRRDVELRMGDVVRALLDWIGRLFSPRASRPAQTRSPQEVRGNPIAWRAIHTGLLGNKDRVLRAGYLTVVLLGLTYGWLFALGCPPSVFRVLGMVLLGVAQFAALLLATSAIAVEKESGSLDLLLSTPLSAAAFVEGKLIAVARHIWPFAFAALAHHLLFAEAEHPIQSMIVAAETVVVSLAFTIGLGLFFSLVSSTTTRAFLLGLAWLVALSALPPLALLVCVFLYWVAVRGCAFVVLGILAWGVLAAFEPHLPTLGKATLWPYWMVPEVGLAAASVYKGLLLLGALVLFAVCGRTFNRGAGRYER